MKFYIKMMRYLLVLLFLFGRRNCQESNGQTILRLQPVSRDSSIQNVNGYGTNIPQSDVNNQASSNNVQFYIASEADKIEEYSRPDRGRNKKIYRIKNPFQRPSDDNENQEKTASSLIDNTPGASYQYSGVQYALPPEDFLRQMRSDNQYRQQSQLSTPSSNIDYTATPHPLFEQTTNHNFNYDSNNLQVNPGSLYDQKITQFQPIVSNYNSYQYSTSNPLGLNYIQNSSPLPGYLSSPIINNFGDSSTSSYVSSSSPAFLSTPENIQHSVSSSYSAFPTGTLDYNKISKTSSGNYFNDNNIDGNRKMQLDHYDNSVNTVKYPINLQNQYQNEYSASTSFPVSSLTDPQREIWLNAANYGINSLSKSLQELQLSPFYNLSHNTQDFRQDLNMANTNGESYQSGNIPSANNIFMNYAQPDYQISNRNRVRNIEQEPSHTEMYSHGDYGWKLQDKKNTDFVYNDGYSTINYPKQSLIQVPENKATSHINFHMNIVKPEEYSGTPSKTSLEAEEFSKAAAKVHENMKKQQFYNNNHYTYNGQIVNTNPLFHQSNAQSNVPDTYSLQDVVSMSPNYQYYSRENTDGKYQKPFDQDKILKNIPVEPSNIVSNSDAHTKITNYDKNNRYNIPNYNKDQIDYYKALTDSYYNVKNSGFEYSIKTKQQHNVPALDILRYSEPSVAYSEKFQHPYNQNGIDENKRQIDGTTQTESFVSHSPNNYWDNSQSSSNIKSNPQNPQFKMHSDLASILKLNDIPYRFTQGLSPESLRINKNFDSEDIPSSLPVKLNQDVSSHQIDAAGSIINRYLISKQQGLSNNKPDKTTQIGDLPTINGFSIVNPYNMDLKLVAEMLKSKSTTDDTHNSFLVRNQFNKLPSLKVDISQLHELLSRHNNNLINLPSLNNDMNVINNNAYLDIYNNGKLPFHGIKYSRSQEEEESIPIAVSSNNYLIGAVVEQDDSSNTHEEGDGNTTEDENVTSLVEDQSETQLITAHQILESPKKSNSVYNRHSYQKKHQNLKMDQPYPLLKPPPPHSPRYRNTRSKVENRNYNRRRINKRKVAHYSKNTQPLFAVGSSEDQSERTVSTLLRPPSIAEPKSDAGSNDDIE